MKKLCVWAVAALLMAACTPKAEKTTSCLEIGIEFEFLTTQIGNGGITQFVKIVWQDFGRKAHSNTFYSLSEHRWQHLSGLR